MPGRDLHELPAVGAEVVEDLLGRVREDRRGEVLPLGHARDSTDADSWVYARVVDRTDAAEDRKKDDGRDRFEKFVEAANQVVSRGPFFVVILAALVLWAVSYPLWAQHHEVGARAAHRVGDPLAAPAGAARERRAPQPGGHPGEAQRDRRGALRPDGVPRPGRPEPRPRRSRGSARPSASRSGTERRPARRAPALPGVRRHHGRRLRPDRLQRLRGDGRDHGDADDQPRAGRPRPLRPRIRCAARQQRDRHGRRRAPGATAAVPAFRWWRPWCCSPRACWSAASPPRWRC